MSIVKILNVVIGEGFNRNEWNIVGKNVSCYGVFVCVGIIMWYYKNL